MTSSLLALATVCFSVGWVACGMFVFGATLRQSMRPTWKPHRVANRDENNARYMAGHEAGFDAGLLAGRASRIPTHVRDGRIEHWELPNDDAAYANLISPSRFVEEV
jgi:hypothetical protein